MRRLRIDGADLDGIHYLRAFANADAIRAEAEDAERLVLVGGSYIACEVAASLTAMGKPCAMVMMESVTLERTFGPEVGGFVQRALEHRGVEIVASDEVERIEGANGRVAKVVSKAGRELEAGCVVIGCGVTPDTMLARGAGLELGDGGGISCSVRLEHWEVAVAQGRTAALGMLGREQEHDTVPYFWSDLGDWATLEYVGAGSGDLVVRGSIDDGDFTGFYLDGARVAAAVTLGRPDDLDHARRMIREATEPDRAALADESTDLAEL